MLYFDVPAALVHCARRVHDRCEFHILLPRTTCYDALFTCPSSAGTITVLCTYSHANILLQDTSTIYYSSFYITATISIRKVSNFRRSMSHRLHTHSKQLVQSAASVLNVSSHPHMVHTCKLCIRNA